MAKSGAHSLSAPDRAAAIGDAVEVARELGLDVGDPAILSDNLNLIVHLRPSPVVARIAVRTAAVRSAETLGDSLRLAAYLAAQGLPVAPPVDGAGAGPHVGRSTGRPMTFWRLIDGARPGDPPNPTQAGRSLRELHDAAAGFTGPLRHLGPLVEIDRLADLIDADRPADAEAIRRFRSRIEVPESAVQAVHGDAHLGNVLVVPRGQIWIDWEESWRGPIAWDLACLDHRRRVFGDLGAEIDAAFRAYGPVDGDAIDAWAPVVALWAMAWGTRGAIEMGEEISDNAKTRRRYLERLFRPATRPASA